MSVMSAVIALAAEEHEEVLQTHHSWTPEWFELVFGGFAFLVVAFGLWKFAIPLLIKALKARSERIGAELDRARSEKELATQAAAAIRADLGDIEAEKARIRAEANAAAETIVTDGRARIVSEAAEVEAKGRADVDLSSGRLVTEVQAEITGLAAAATEQVVMGSLDSATQQSLIEEFIAKVGASR
jgi:F-type H+-transporting ATPase subunit b